MQAPYGPVDVGGVNFGSGANAFWPGTGSYSTFGLYSNSNAEVLPARVCSLDSFPPLPTCTDKVLSRISWSGAREGDVTRWQTAGVPMVLFARMVEYIPLSLLHCAPCFTVSQGWEA